MLRTTIFSVLLTVFAASGAAAAATISSATPPPVLTPLPVAPVPPGANIQKLVYQVKHSSYGNLGTYTNTVEKLGDMTSVVTEGHLKVTGLGISLYRQDISRVERWSGNRLVYFHGITTENGKSVELNGKADGDKFMLQTPQGSVVAPASVRIANPWCKEAVMGSEMLTPDRGKLENVTMTGEEETSIMIGGRPTHVHHYLVQRGAGPRRYEVWLDDRNTPVQFAVVSPKDTVTFTLQG